jgi:hypothetical protein
MKERRLQYLIGIEIFLNKFGKKLRKIEVQNGIRYKKSR